MIGKDLKRLFLAHRRELQTYLNRRLRDREMAADLTQETFLRFAEQGSRTTIVDDRSYLYRTARNLAIDHVRRIGRHRTDSTTHDDLADLPENLPGPEQIVDGRQRLDRLRTIVEGLPKRTRQVFVLNRIEGLTYSEIAGRLGISISSVQKHLASALQHVLQRTDLQ
ncbi:RNA polymerase sigma factor [Reyranella sp.]|uniref:RNA polymerase sigma factor n=1 Tax=Reyranella sp. TaxID=1929291 RepID=UPI00122A3344|nr:RNA polymerase sigma factor [Reyranella sp.]TAJ84774.1 MAG: RNA polymerase sigma factor [Reyranella sp.]